MGIIMAICELEAANALCKDLKMDLKKANIPSVEGFEEFAEFDWVVDLDAAQDKVDDWEAFMKRNRFSPDVQAIYLDKLKKEEDIEALRPAAVKTYNGWVDVSLLSDAKKEKLVSIARKEDRITAWDMLSFDEMNGTCSSCGLSWDKGRGCIGAFGPENSLLPEIATRRNCPIIGSVFEAVEKGRIYTPAEAKSMLDEISRLKDELPEEGKMMVRRYGGVLERLEAMADVCVTEGCGFRFF